MQRIDPPSSVRAALRDATHAAHADVDASFSRFDIGDVRGYAGFLRAQAGAVFAVERALEAAQVSRWIPDWPARRRADLLRADLAMLAAGSVREVDFAPLEDAADVFGAAYVLEGSRLGARLLLARLREQAPAALDVATAFLGANGPPGGWPRFLAALEAQHALDRVRMIAAARRVFSAFLASAQHHATPRRGVALADAPGAGAARTGVANTWQ